MNNGYVELLARGSGGERKSGWIYEHRLVASQAIGRPLTDEEVVHHKDENRQNNDPENLMVFATSSDHTRFHRTGVAVLREDGIYVSPGIPRTKSGKPITGSCIMCGEPCHNKYCSLACAAEASKRVAWPSREELMDALQVRTVASIAKQYGVSFNAVKKWAARYGLPASRAARKLVASGN